MDVVPGPGEDGPAETITPAFERELLWKAAAWRSRPEQRQTAPTTTVQGCADTEVTRPAAM